MANVNVKFNNKEYLLSCEEGQEENLKELANYLDSKYNNLKKNLGNIGEGKLLLIAAIQMVDDYFDLKKKVDTKKNDFEKLSIKFKELRSLAINYKDEKEKEIEKLKDQLSAFEKKIEETLEVGGRQILLQGGHNNNLKIDYFEDLFKNIKAKYNIHLHALSPSEILHTSRISKISLNETLKRMKVAGLDSIPGGGAEILVDRVRQIISPKKCSSDEWLEVMEQAHRMDIPTTATMMFGHVETLEERIEHLDRLRQLQDKTGGFTAFIAWGFQPGNTELQGQTGIKTAVSGFEYLKTLAISRIFLDNFDNLQSSWVTQGPKIGQVSLYYGANDMGSTMMEENVVAAAGTVYCLDEEEIKRLIIDGGFAPQRRNMQYQPVD